MSAIFLSHSSVDSEIAAEIRDWLEERGHRSVFLDFDPERGIPPGRSWERELYRQLRSCRAVVVLCSDHSRASRWCFAEITQARSLGKNIVPIKVADCEVEGLLTDLQVIDLTRAREEGFERLARALVVAGVDASDPFDWDATRPPYPGLLALQEADAAIFFGRDEEIGDGLDALNRVRWQAHCNFVMILGASGAGKSSLLRAGLLPKLRRDLTHWRIVGPFKPGDQPLRELAAALAEAFREAGAERDWQQLRERLAAVPDIAVPDIAVPDIAVPDIGATNPLLELAEELRLGSAGREAKILIVIDQFEELLGREAAHPSGPFLELLRGTLDLDATPILVLGTMRSDFLGVFQQHPSLTGLAFDPLTLGPMTEEDLAQVIEKPAALAGIDVEPGLSQAMLHDATSAGTLPLVAFTLRELYTRYGAAGRLTVEQYRERLGGLDGAVARVAESVLPEAEPFREIRVDLRRAFTSMVRITEEGQFARLPVAWSELPPATHPLLRRFVEARLLISKDVDGTEMVEVAHEALFSAWRKFSRWLEESRAALQMRKEVARAARQWNEKERAEEYLWTQGRLQRALEFRTQGELPLSQEEQDFLAESERVEQLDRQRRRRLRRLLLVSAVTLTVIMTGLAIFALASRRTEVLQRRHAQVQAANAQVQAANAQVQTAKALAIQSRTAVHRLDQALLLAVAASRRLEALGEPGDVYDGRTSLLYLMMQQPRLLGMSHGHQDRVETISWRPDGAQIATGSFDGRLLLWNAGERQPALHLDHCALVARLPSEPVTSCGERIKAAVFNPDSTWLASGSEHGKILLWNTSTYELAQVLQEEGILVTALAFSPDGNHLASADLAGRLRLWNLASGEPEDLGSHDAWISAIVFHPDGTLVSAATDKTVRLWKIEPSTGTVLYRGGYAVKSLALSAGKVAAGFTNGDIRLWEWPPTSGWRVLENAHQDEVVDLTFTPDGRRLISAGNDGIVHIWDEETAGSIADLSGHVGGATALAVEPLAGGRMVTGSGDGLLQLFTLDEVERALVTTDHPAGVAAVAFGAGELVASSGVDGSLRLRDRNGWHPGPSVGPEEDEVWGLAISSDDRLLATGTGNLAVRLWDLEQRQVVFESIGQSTWLWSVAFSADGTLLASADEEGLVVVRKVPGGDPLLRLEPGGSVLSLAFSPVEAEPMLALGLKNGHIEIRHPRTGERLAACEGHADSAVTDLAFSRDAQRLASASLDGTARVWTVGGSCDKPELVLDARGVGMLSVAFDAAGKSLATGDLQGVIRIWDAVVGAPRLGLLGHRGRVLELAFTDEGILLSGGADRTLRRWDMAPVATLDRAYEHACRLANRDLDLQEWARFFGQAPYASSCPDSLTASPPPAPRAPSATGKPPGVSSMPN